MKKKISCNCYCQIMVYEICDGVCHFAFVDFGEHVWVVHLDLDTMVASFVTKKYFYCSIFGEE